MKLLLVAVAVCAVWPRSVLTKPSKQDLGDIHPIPYEIRGPPGSNAQPIQYNLYSYSVNNNPFENNIHQYGENPVIPESDNEIYQDQFPLDRGSVPLQVFTYNARSKHPLGQLSEQHSGGHILFDENKIDLVPPYQNPKNAQSIDKKLVCYFESWATKRTEPYEFAVADIDPFACTHIIYSFAGLDNTTWSIKSLDPELDIDQGLYKAAIGLKAKNPNLKVMIAIGGWAEGGENYSEMVSKKERRDTFVASVISFMEEHKWDGLDLDWEYPGAGDRGGRPSDKANFAALVSELSAEFKTRGWLLTAAVTPARFRVNDGYDVAKIAQDLDYIFVMTYDLRGIWYGKADHHAPLSSREIDEGLLKFLNAKDGLNYWNSKGAPMHKLLMGIPFYARTFRLTSKSNTKPGAPAKSGGYMEYHQICKEQRKGGWEIKRDSAGGPYMVKGDLWVGYDDTEYLATKMSVVHEMGLGGAFMWAINHDDYKGLCGPRWPLINTMRKGLYGSDGMAPVTPAPTRQTAVNTEANSCVSQSDCPSTHACVNWMCQDPCVARCGPNAECKVYNRQGYCSCPLNYTGNPYLHCSEIVTVITAIIDDKFENSTTTTELPTSIEVSQSCVDQSGCPSTLVCVDWHCLDPCVALCGPNAKCHVYNRLGYCSCPINYTGNPYLHCSEIDAATTANIDDKIVNTNTSETTNEASQTQSCLSQSDCPSTHACVGRTCLDPCVARCGPNAECKVYDRQGYCSCLLNYTGNPYRYCSEIDVAAAINIDDKIENTTTTATELPDDQTETSIEESQSCVNQNDCPSSHACVGRTCMDPCVARCGPNAKCQVYNRLGYCTCPTDYTGNPYLHCSEIDAATTENIDDKIENTSIKTELPEDQTETSIEESQSCFNQSDCPSNLACVGSTCLDPCVARCAPNAECQVYNRQPYCSCSTNYTGNPYLECSQIAENPAPTAESLEVTTALAITQSITTNPAEESICSGSGYLRDESKCSVYYLCNPELVAYKFTCPEGLYFDLQKSTCNWQHNVKCENDILH